MPLTPYHVGPVLLAAFLFDEYIDVTAAVVGSTVPDIGPLMVLLGMGSGPLHGPFHTFIGAFLLATITASLLFYAKPWLNTYLEPVRLAQPRSYRLLFAGAVLGTFSQVLFDGVVYADVQPFFPVQWNPLYGVAPFSVVFGFLLVCFPAAGYVYWRQVYRRSW